MQIIGSDQNLILLHPLSENHFKLGYPGLKHKVHDECALELDEQAVTFAKGCRFRIHQMAEETHICQIDFTGKNMQFNQGTQHAITFL
ncbi:hypothetical protein HMPREF1548_05100 [Clostridium sp. KLE 1755]|nr:hypothetical protein HMPREF1548_05100 [Clostridium sp. KLE 1755]